MDLHPAGTLLRVDHHLVDEMMKHATWNHYKERLLTAGATHIVHLSLWAATTMQRTSANYWVFWLFADFISYQQDSRQCLDRDSPISQVRLMPTGTSRSTTMNLWQLGSYLEHFSSFLSLLLLTIAYSKNSIADSLDPYVLTVPWLLGHGPAEQWKTVASISCCQPWEPRSGTQDVQCHVTFLSASLSYIQIYEQGDRKWLKKTHDISLCHIKNCRVLFAGLKLPFNLRSAKAATISF